MITDSYKFSKKWIKQRHSINEIRLWLTDLHYFKYFRAHGGHMNDGDSFKICLNFDNINDLKQIIQKLGFKLLSVDIFASGQFDEVTFEEFKHIPSSTDTIKSFPEYLKPGIQYNLDTEWFLWVVDNKLTFRISGTGIENKFDVSDYDFKKCKEMEKLLIESNLIHKIDSDFNYRSGCISLENYPELFKNIK